MKSMKLIAVYLESEEERTLKVDLAQLQVDLRGFSDLWGSAETASLLSHFRRPELLCRRRRSFLWYSAIVCEQCPPLRNVTHYAAAHLPVWPVWDMRGSEGLGGGGGGQRVARFQFLMSDCWGHENGTVFSLNSVEKRDRKVEYFESAHQFHHRQQF